MMQPRSLLTHLLLFLFALLPAPLPASADIALPVWGSSGNNSYSDRCPGGFYLVGVNVGMGAWYDQIGLVCAQVQPNLTFTNKQFPRLHGGNGGGAPVDYSCNDDEVVTGVLPRYVDNDNRSDNLGEVAALTLVCRSVKSGATRNLFVNAAYPAGSIVNHYPESTQRCPDNTVAVGLNLRFGRYVNAVGLICDTYVPPPPVAAQAPPPKPIKTTGKAKDGAGSGPSAPPGLLVCRLGPTMKPFGNPSADSMLLTFDAAPQGANVALPGPGQCAWDVQPISPNQVKRLGLGKSVLAQLTGAQVNTVFKVHAWTMSAFLMTTGTVEIIPPEGAEAPAAQAGEPAQGGGDVGEAGGGGEPAGGMAGGMGVPSGDCPAGTAMVKTPAGLDLLNVREGPSSGATVVAQVPNGSEVTVSGGCFKAAAGLTQQKVKIPVGGWCRIEAPDQGCVSAQFLVFAGQGGDGDVPIDPGKGAGLAKQTLAPKSVGKGGGSFSGQWNVTDDNNVAYSMNLVQAGSGVTGQFKGADGSRGTLVGKVSGNTLRFAWVQTNDGQKGSGKFVLAGDGGSFSGSYNFQVGNFDKVEGQWNGQRQ